MSNVQTVYKFCRKYGLEVLSNLELKVTPPNQFNDPFEFTPKMVLSDPDRYVKRLLQKETILKALCESDPPPCGVQAYLRWAKRHPDKLIEQLQKLLPELVAENEKQFLYEISREWGILCMSGVRSQILMWGHYSDSHLGLVIGFDRSSPIFQEGVMALTPVKYVRKRPFFDSSWDDRSQKMALYRQQMMTFKNDDWSYENEFRQILTLSSLPLVPRLHHDRNSGLKSTYYFLPFPPAAVVSVTVGPRCSPEFEKQVSRVLQKRAFSHVKLDRAILHKSDFVLEFDPVPPV